MASLTTHTDSRQTETTLPPATIIGEIQTVPRRPRRYVSPALLTLLRPVLRFSFSRDAYVLRLVGDRFGPVLRPKIETDWRELRAG